MEFIKAKVQSSCRDVNKRKSCTQLVDLTHAETKRNSQDRSNALSCNMYTSCSMISGENARGLSFSCYLRLKASLQIPRSLMMVSQVPNSELEKRKREEDGRQSNCWAFGVLKTLLSSFHKEPHPPPEALD